MKIISDEYENLRLFEKRSWKKVKMLRHRFERLLEENATGEWVIKNWRKLKDPRINYAFISRGDRQKTDIIEVPKKAKGLIIDGVKETFLKTDGFMRFRLVFKISRPRLLFRKQGAKIRPWCIVQENDRMGSCLRFYLKDYKLRQLWSFIKRKITGEESEAMKQVFREEIKGMEEEIIFLYEKEIKEENKKESKKITKKAKRRCKKLLKYEEFANVLVNLN